MTPLETAPCAVSHLSAMGRSPAVVGAIMGDQSCMGYRQSCFYSRAKEPFLGQPEGALVPEVLLRDFPLCSRVEATFLAVCLAPTMSWPLLTAEGWEAGGDNEKPGPQEVYLRTTMLQSKMQMCFLWEAAGRDSTGGQDGRGRAEHVAGAGGYCGGHREGAVPSQNGGLQQSIARRPPMWLPAPCWVPVCQGAMPEGRRRLPSREVGGGDASSFPG